MFRRKELEDVILRFFHEEAEQSDSGSSSKDDNTKQGASSEGKQPKVEARENADEFTQTEQNHTIKDSSEVGKAPGLPEGLLDQALLVGLGPKRRRRLERKQRRQDAEGTV